MRWLWQYAAQWAKSRVWSEARRAATEQVAADHEPVSDADASATVMAVVCETKRLFDAVADTLGRQRHLEGDRFAVCAGKLAGKRLVVVRSLSASPNCRQLIDAVVDGHHPKFVLAAGEATSRSAEVTPGSLVVASQVFDDAGQSLRLDGVAPPISGFFTGGVAPRSAGESTKLRDCANAPLAADDWSGPIARACQQVGLPMMSASVVLEPVDEQRSKQVESLKSQSSLAGRAGVLTGMLWKKRSGLRDLWNEKEAAWEGCNRLAKLAEKLIAAANG